MGDPRHFKNKYDRPKKLWDETRIAEQSALKKEYGLKNAREVWLAETELRKYRREARRLLSLAEEERVKDVKKIMQKLSKYEILSMESTLDDVLSLDVRSVLERRLQTRVYKKGLAKTLSQARQLVAHGFISINGRRLTSPSYLVTKDDDTKIGYYKPITIEVKKPATEQAAPAPAKAAEGGA